MKPNVTNQQQGTQEHEWLGQENSGYYQAGCSSTYLQSCKRAPMGGAPYKSAKEFGGVLFKVFPRSTTIECPCHVCSDLIGQIVMYNGATSDFEDKSRWHTTLSLTRQTQPMPVLSTFRILKAICTGVDWICFHVIVSKVQLAECNVLATSIFACNLAITFGEA